MDFDKSRGLIYPSSNLDLFASLTRCLGRFGLLYNGIWPDNLVRDKVFRVGLKCNNEHIRKNPLLNSYLSTSEQNLSHQLFVYKSLKCSFSTLTICVCIYSQKEIVEKATRKMLMRLTPGLCVYLFSTIHDVFRK